MEIAIGAALISTTLRPLVDLAMEKAKAMVVDKVEKVTAIERDISKLQTTLFVIEGIVQVAEQKQIDESYIRNWLRDLVDIGYEARDVLEDFSVQVGMSSIITAEEAKKPVNTISSLMLSCWCGSSSDTSNIPLAILNRLEKDIRSVRERLDEKIKESETFTKLKSVVGGGFESVRVEHDYPYLNQQADNLFFGSVDKKEEIMEKILHPSDDNRVNVVAIWGMGGIGKTTLARSIYNDERVKEDDYPTKNRQWLCVGVNKFGASEILEEMVDDQNTTAGINNLQTKLVEKFRGNRFLIVLDDVWDVDRCEWDLLFNPLTHVGKGGFIIITTRRREVCEATNTQIICDLGPLSEEDSWSIFESCAYVNGKSDSTPDLQCIGKKIVKKLNGLPLALKVVGRSLLNKDSSTWTNFLESKFTNDDEVMSALRWSYNHLPRHLKTCFTYCYLFPKHHVLDKKVLVEMWMAHDLIQKEKQKRPEDVGAQYFEELVNASLLQCVDGKYVMHDLIHNLALHVSNGEITHVVSNGEFATANGSLTYDQMKKVRHITITGDDYSNIPRQCKIEKLLTLYTTRNQIYTTEKFDYSVLDDVFKQLKSIRVLVLDSSKFTDIPDCISELRHLRYLDVSETNVTRLPESLCHLYNLQMLAAPLYAVLPRDVRNMVNLRYIRANLSTCKGVGKLTSLQELSSIHVCEGDNISELGNMQRLRGKLTIKGLENVISKDAAGALMKKQTLMDELELVFNQHLQKSTISEEILDDLGCPSNLRYLQIYGYTGVKPPRWMVDTKHKFDKLQTLELSHCPKLEFLPPLGELTSLKHLILCKVGVKRLRDEFYGKFTDGKVFFPSLESLVFYKMEEWEKWDDIIIENSSVSFFPCLTYLNLSFCPKLESLLPLGELTSLKHLILCKVGVKRLGEEFYGKFTDGKKFFPSLESLVFSDMFRWEEWDDIIIPNSSMSFFPRLTSLNLSFCPKLESLPPLKELVRLKLNSLKIENFPKLRSLPADFYELYSLERLEIISCLELQSLPPDFHKLSSLNSLKIVDCPQLQSLPAGGFPSTMKSLELLNCPLLYERCKDEFGSDWHKIKHIREKTIFGDHKVHRYGGDR